MSKLEYVKGEGAVLFINRSRLGFIAQMEDGLYKWFPPNFNGYYVEDWCLRDILSKVDELNSNNRGGEYIIVNKTKLLERIEELESDLIPENYIIKHNAQAYALKQVISQSIPLIAEIEKAYDEGFDYREGNHKSLSKQDYISNLKLGM